MEHIAEECARMLTFRYESQIRQLEERGARILAECGVRRMLESMRSGSLDALEDTESLIVDQLVNSIVQVDKRQGVLAIKHQEIPTLVVRPKKHRWHESHVFKKPGLKTPQGDYYSGPSTDVAQYGYRMGTAEEAKALGYTMDNFRRAASIDLNVVCFNPSPKLKGMLASRTTPSKKTEQKFKTVGPTVPPKRLLSFVRAVPSSPPPPPPRAATEVLSSARWNSLGSISELTEAPLAKPAITPEKDRAVSPAKCESPAGPSPTKGDLLDTQDEIRELKALMAATLERLAQESSRVTRLEAKVEEQKSQLHTANSRIAVLEEQLSDASWTHRIQELFLKQLQAIGWTSKGGRDAPQGK